MFATPPIATAIFAALSPAAMQYLPWALIPTVLVLYLLISHAIIFAQLRASARAG